LKSTQPVQDARLLGYTQVLVEKIAGGGDEKGGNEYVYHARLASHFTQV